MTIKEGIYDIREAINAYNIDSEVSNRHIYFLMNTFRRQIVRQHVQRNPGEHRDQLTQTLYYALENVDNSRFPENFLTEFTVRRTSANIPNIIGQQIFKEIEVRNLERLEMEIEVIHKSRAAEIAYAPKGFIYAYLDDDRRLYLVSTDSLHIMMEQITVTAILENPSDIEDINNMTTELEDYPLPSQMWARVRELVLQSISQKFAVPLDILNDNIDEQIPNTQA